MYHHDSPSPSPPPPSSAACMYVKKNTQSYSWSIFSHDAYCHILLGGGEGVERNSFALAPDAYSLNMKSIITLPCLSWKYVYFQIHHCFADIFGDRSIYTLTYRIGIRRLVERERETLRIVVQCNFSSSCLCNLTYYHVFFFIIACAIDYFC